MLPRGVATLLGLLGWLVLATSAVCSDPARPYEKVQVETASTSIYIGKVTLHVAPLTRQNGVFSGDYKAKVFPYFFMSEHGTFRMTVSDDDLGRLARGETVEFSGEAENSGREARKVTGRRRDDLRKSHCYTAFGPKLSLEVRGAGMGAIRATVAAVLILFSAVVSAADCVTTSRLISTRASVPNLVAGPSAWSGSVLAVAKFSEAGPNEVWLGVYAEGLETLVNDRRVATNASDATSIVALLWNGAEFGLFYRTDERIQLQRLTMMGESIGAPVAVNPDRRPRLGDDIEVVWSAALDAWVVARHIGSGPNRGIWITLLESNGVERFDLEIPAAPPTDPHLTLAVTDTGVIGLFYLTEDDNTLVYTRIVPGEFPDSRSISSAGTEIRAVADGALFVVARLVGEGPTAEIRWFIVDTDFHLVRPDGVLVAGGPRLLLGLIRNDDELAMTYGIPPPGVSIIPDLHLRRFTLAGALISDTRFAGADFTVARALSTYPPVWTGTSYITAAVRETTSRLDSYLVRYCPLRVEITGPRIVLVGQPVTLTGETSGGVPSYDYAWTITRDPGGFNNLPTLQRTFFATGSRVATLVVTDETGATTTASFTLEVVDEIEVVTTKRRAVRK